MSDEHPAPPLKGWQLALPALAGVAGLAGVAAASLTLVGGEANDLSSLTRGSPTLTNVGAASLLLGGVGLVGIALERELADMARSVRAAYRDAERPDELGS